MVGCVGEDAYGEQLRESLLGEGIDCQAVDRVPGSSGVALIVVDDSSQNAIVIVAGGNGELSPEKVVGFDPVLQQAEVIICQLEVPQETVGYTLKRGRELGKTVILNPAPATGPLPESWYGSIDYLIPNESEATALTGLEVDSWKAPNRPRAAWSLLVRARSSLPWARRGRCLPMVAASNTFLRPRSRRSIPRRRGYLCRWFRGGPGRGQKRGRRHSLRADRGGPVGDASRCTAFHSHAVRRSGVYSLMKKTPCSILPCHAWWPPWGTAMSW